LKNIGLWWRYGINRHCDEWKYIIIGRIFESEIILIPPSLKISESSSNGSYRNTDEVWWKYGISQSCDEWWHLFWCHCRKNVRGTERGRSPEMRDDRETSSSFKINHLWLFYRYDSMFIKDLVMWRHYNVILENSDITIRVLHNA
jgi:hypothetical protein